MSLIQQIKDEINRSQDKEVFTTFDDLFLEFLGGQPDRFRPIRPVDLNRMHKEAAEAGLEDFQKGLAHL